jgi:ribose 5-phosphate isomerase B
VRIAVGADHAGIDLKNHLAELLRGAGHEVEDLGTHTAESVDYPDFARKVAEHVAEGGAERGILVCGTGIGVAISANKVHGIRAANCNDLFTARMARAHNDANILTLGARVVGEGVAEETVKIFLATEFEAGRHQRRVDKISDLEQ